MVTASSSAPRKMPHCSPRHAAYPADPCKPLDTRPCATLSDTPVSCFTRPTYAQPWSEQTQEGRLRRPSYFHTSSRKSIVLRSTTYCLERVYKPKAMIICHQGTDEMKRLV